MSILADKLRQTAVYWELSSFDGYGQPSFAAGVEKTLRWADKQELFLNSDRKEELSAAIIYIDFDIELNDYFYLGGLSDLTAGEIADPLQCDDAYKVKMFSKIANISGTEFVRKGWLK